MQVTWKNDAGNIEINFESASLQDVIRKVAFLDRYKESMGSNKDIDLFEALAELDNTDIVASQTCGKCNSGNVKYVVREVDDNKYYEYRCMNCYAKLQCGVNKKGGGLFIKRRDDEGKIKGSNGWTKYNKETEKEE